MSARIRALTTTVVCMSRSRAPIRHFLLVFDHASAQLVADVEEFDTDARAATRRYEEVEAMYRDQASVDVVLVGSDSIETVRMTHSNYFTEAVSVERRLAELLDFRPGGVPAGR